MSLQNLGRRIRSERQRRKITQEQLAEKADISLNFMSLIENGRNMSVETLIKISEALGVSIDYLLSDKIDFSNDSISEQIIQCLATLNDDERLFFLNMIKQYKTLR